MNLSRKIFLVFYDYAKKHNGPEVGYLQTKIYFSGYLMFWLLIIHQISMKLKLIQDVPPMQSGHLCLYVIGLLGFSYFALNRLFPSFEEVEGIDIDEAIPNKFGIWVTIYLFLAALFSPLLLILK